ncbi:MAG: L,D-transpeptidase [Oscillospiraceae bacterium]|nr:L,D-transpeptidase [Oscillospiraceae bacterium]
MKGHGKGPIKQILLAALILFVGAGATYAALDPGRFAAGVSAAVEWMKFDRSAVAAEPESSSCTPVSSTPISSAPVQESSVPPASSEPEAVTVSLEKAAKPLKIDVSLQDQKVRVLDAESRLVQEFLCSSGKEGSETPIGTFTIAEGSKSRGMSFYNPRVQEGAYYWTRFYNAYLFHSVPFDENEEMEPEEAAKLGTPASHGCIRLTTENAKWIYDHIPAGTKVVIQ